MIKCSLIDKKWWSWHYHFCKKLSCGFTEKSKVILNFSNSIFQKKTPTLYWNWLPTIESLYQSKNRMRKVEEHTAFHLLSLQNNDPEWSVIDLHTWILSYLGILTDLRHLVPNHIPTFGIQRSLHEIKSIVTQPLHIRSASIIFWIKGWKVK